MSLSIEEDSTNMGLYKLACSTALCAAVFLFSGSNPQQGVPQSSASSATKAALYFPSGAVDGFANLFSDYLSRIDEPSLLAAAQDPSAISYRFESLAGQSGQMLAVRLSLNPDGSARIFTREESGTPRVLHRTEKSVPAAGVNKFLQLVEKASFWSMPAIEPENSDARRKAYKMDASTWVFDGVRTGGYHVVFRQGPEPSPFTEMVHFLEKDLAKLDESVIPRTSSTSSINSSGALPLAHMSYLSLGA
jgi:hypothetical protein